MTVLDRSALWVDRQHHVAAAGDRVLRLTRLEFELYAHLLEHPYVLMSRRHLLEAVWGTDRIDQGRTVDVHVARLRRTVGPAFRTHIQTVHGFGYRYRPLSPLGLREVSA